MSELSSGSRLVLGLSLTLIPTIAYGGFSVLQMLLGRIPGYHENPRSSVLVTPMLAF